MKVAYFIGSLNRGGTETLVLDTFRKRDSAPYEIILVYRNEGELSNDYRATGVPMFRIKPHGMIGYVFRLRKLLKRQGVNILHTQTLRNALLGVFCTVFSKIKLVASFHGFITYFSNKLIAPFVMLGVDSAVFVSDYEREWYVDHVPFTPKKRSYVVYNGIDFSKFKKDYPTPAFLEEDAPALTGIVRMAMVGNFVRGRSQRFLCEVFKTLKDGGRKNIHLFFIGKQSPSEPERYDDCLQYCRENGLLDSSVFFLGGRSDVPAILQHVDAFVYSSDYDTFGIAVVEAMASGIPVLVNDWVVMKEITDQGRLATLYRSLDIDDCVSKLEDLATHIREKKAFAQGVAGIVRQRFSIENHICSLGKVYEATLG